MASLIIPAHNEAATIGRCLESALGDARPGEFDVFVVCNGCSDATAEVASGYGTCTAVIEIPDASKNKALNAGDLAATRWPKIYLDADVLVSTAALRAVVEEMARTGCPAGAAPLAVNTVRSSKPVRAYYRVWTALPYVTDKLVGSGMYVLSQEGRGRFDKFDHLADDLMVRNLFAANERSVPSGSEPFTIQAPPTLRALIKVRSRVFAYNQAGVDVSPPDGAASGGLKSVLSLVKSHPNLLGPALIFAGVQAGSKALAFAELRTRGLPAWRRDNSLREA